LAVEMAVKIISHSRNSEDPKWKIWLLDIREKASIYINSEVPESQCDILLTRCFVYKCIHASILLQNLYYTGYGDRSIASIWTVAYFIWRLL